MIALVGGATVVTFNLTLRAGRVIVLPETAFDPLGQGGSLFHAAGLDSRHPIA